MNILFEEDAVFRAGSVLADNTTSLQVEASPRASAPSTSPTAAAVGPLLVPASVVVRRAEMTGVYVLDGQGRPLLRQVRLGRPAGGMVEVLSGVRAGDRIALKPQAAAKVR